MPNIDPELTRALSKCRDSSRNLQVLVSLERVGKEGVEPWEVQARVEALVQEAREASALKPSRVVVFSSLNIFSVEAPVKFFDTLLLSNRVASATLNP